IDCSDALPRRAASATEISPPMTARTSRYLSSTEKTEGRATDRSLHEEPDTNPPARIRDAGDMKPGAVHSVSTGAPGGRWSWVGCSLPPASRARRAGARTLPTYSCLQDRRRLG